MALFAAQEQARFAVMRGDEDAAQAAEARALRLQEVGEVIVAADRERLAQQTAGKAAAQVPGTLVAQATALLVLAYVVATLLVWLMGVSRRAGARPHPMWGRMVLTALCAAFPLFLLVYDVALRTTVPPESLPLIGLLWRGLLVLGLLGGPLYAYAALPNTQRIAQRHGRPRRQTRAPYRRACAGMLRRYYGVLAGGWLIGLCVWVLVYRLLHAHYPILKSHLGVPGYRTETLALLQEVVQRLQ